MFDRAQPSKRVKAWRADPGLLSGSGRGFAATHWGEGDDGFMVDDIKRTKNGFALDEYAQVPLSPQAIKALKQLQALEPEENEGVDIDEVEATERFQVETWNANAHLPFVVDAYEFDDEVHDSVTVEETVLPETQTAEVSVAPRESVAETNTAHENAREIALTTSADVQLDETGIAAEATQAAEKSEETQTTQAGEAKDQFEEEKNTIEVAAEAEHDEVSAQAQEESLTEVEAQVAAEVETTTEVGAQANTTTEVESAIEAVETQAESQAEEVAPADDAVEVEAASAAQVETDLTESDLTGENTVAPEQMAASVEDVVDDVTLPEPVLAGIDPEVAEQRAAEKFAEGLAQGIAQGERQAREAMQQEVQAQCTVLANVTQELHALLKDSKAFYEPLKRLSLHLAEQIVMGELRTSTQAIEQLIQRCLDELDHPAQGLVVLELNPQDKNRLLAQNPELIQGMRLEAVQDMQPGSVRLFANDTVVEDLVAHRLEALAQSMLVDVATWKAQSALAKPEASTQDLESEDVHP